MATGEQWATAQSYGTPEAESWRQTLTVQALNASIDPVRLFALVTAVDYYVHHDGPTPVPAGVVQAAADFEKYLRTGKA